MLSNGPCPVSGRLAAFVRVSDAEGELESQRRIIGMFCAGFRLPPARARGQMGGAPAGAADLDTHRSSPL
jgi:hypothetical protein